MKGRLIFAVILIILAVCADSCDDHGDYQEKGVAVALSVPWHDGARDITLWVFNKDGILQSEYRYASPEHEASALLPLPGGEYTVVGVTNVEGTFSYKTERGVTRLEELFLMINDASSSPVHPHYGAVKASVPQTGISRIRLPLKRVMAEFSMTVKNIPPEVTDASLEVVNSSCGFYPGAGRLGNETAPVSTGTVIPGDGKLTFLLMNVMPVVQTGSVKGVAEMKTGLRLKIRYDNGGVFTFDLETPALQNGGIYTPEIEYALLRPGIVIEVSQINGWLELPPIYGEILNPGE